jgi:hypothetical protein
MHDDENSEGVRHGMESASSCTQPNVTDANSIPIAWPQMWNAFISLFCPALHEASKRQYRFLQSGDRVCNRQDVPHLFEIPRKSRKVFVLETWHCVLEKIVTLY